LKVDLDALWELAYAAGLTLPNVEHWPLADYAYRIVCDRPQAMATLALLMQSIDYSNFKSMIARSPTHCRKLTAYHDVWHTMAELQRP
jgi:hypothetical protein